MDGQFQMSRYASPEQNKCWICGGQLIVLAEPSSTAMFTVTENRCVNCGTYQSAGPQANWDAASDEALANFESLLDRKGVE